MWVNFSQGSGTPGTQRHIAFSQLAVKGLIQDLLFTVKQLFLSYTTFYSNPFSLFRDILFANAHVHTEYGHKNNGCFTDNQNGVVEHHRVVDYNVE
jgi:hypothetical protein